MERINRNNYEAWFLDYIEGQLDQSGVEELFSFLERHPELKTELESDLGEIVLTPDFDQHPNIEMLKVNADEILISESTADDIMIMAVEGELNQNQKVHLDQYVEENGLLKDYKAYQRTKLQPDLSEKMPDKKQLKVKAKVIPLYVKIASVAAAIVFLFGIIWNDETPDKAIGLTAKGIVLPAESSDINALELIEHNIQQSEPFELAENDVNTTEVIKKKNIPLPNANEGQLVVHEESKDTSKSIVLPKIIKDDQFEKADIAMNDQDSVQTDKVNINVDDLPNPDVKKEEPYKLITDAAGNLLNKDVSFTRDKNVASDEYVAYSFRLGSFEFERKKSK